MTRGAQHRATRRTNMRMYAAWRLPLSTPPLPAAATNSRLPGGTHVATAPPHRQQPPLYAPFMQWYPFRTFDMRRSLIPALPRAKYLPLGAALSANAYMRRSRRGLSRMGVTLSRAAINVACVRIYFRAPSSRCRLARSLSAAHARAHSCARASPTTPYLFAGENDVGCAPSALCAALFTILLAHATAGYPWRRRR